MSGWTRGRRFGNLAGAAIILFATIVGVFELPVTSASGSSPVIHDVAPPSVPRARVLGGPSQVIEGEPDERDEAFYLKRTAGDPAVTFTMQDAAAKRASAAETINQTNPSSGNTRAFTGSWTALGPDPIVQLLRDGSSFGAMSGRVSALAIRSTSPYTMYLGAAQGGVWISSTLTSGWTSKTDNLPSLAIGSIALAPSNEDIVYVGTGEGNLSGDSYFGNGILKSTDAGNTFSLVSASSAFSNVSISKIVVHPTDQNHLWATALRGIAGVHRTGPVNATPYGVYESTDGGINWTGLITTTDASRAPTDLVIDPINPNELYTAFYGQGISKTVDSGLTWTSVMTGFPGGADYAAAPTRFSLAISHPSSAVSATLYSGFEYYSGATRQPSSVWKSTNEGQSWSQTSTTVIGDYCASQCWYDNVVAADPISPTVVYALGLFIYGNPGSGGIFRSMDGGASWVDLGFNLHPDYHAVAIRKDDPANLVIGNDGGVWSTATRGGRLGPSDPLTATEWINLNGSVNAADGTVLGRSGLQIAQFTSVGQHPSNTNAVYGGTQDNGTLGRPAASSTWVDYSSGDGGQVLVDQTDPNYVYGTYFGLSPYRFTNGMLGGPTGGTANAIIASGINSSDRSEFYVPFAMDPANPDRLYIGSYRLYRTENAKAPTAGAVTWSAISSDLTSGCLGGAPNGARNCSISAIGVTPGAPAVYVGTLDRYVWISTNANAASPTWTRIDKAPLPDRPVSAIAVDSSDYRVAYVAYSGFSAATPGSPGHLFKTTDAGATWTNVSGNLPDVPLNSIVIDPGVPGGLYAGTDIGPYVTTNGGSTWSFIGTGFPIVSINQLSLNPATRRLRAATHGRGAWSLTDAMSTPALQIRGSGPAIPVGPGSPLTITVVAKNVGNATATGVVITNVVPISTTFVSASSGGALNGSVVTWSGLSIAAGSAVTVAFTALVTTTGVTPGSVITNASLSVMSSQGVGATASPFAVTLSANYGVNVTSAAQADGGRPSQTITYTLTAANQGAQTDSFDVSVAGNTFPTSIFDASCVTPITRTQTVAGGGSVTVCARVVIPPGAAGGSTDTASVTLRSAGNPALSAAVSLTTTAVTKTVLLVDQDGNNPANVQSYYTTALTTAGYQYDTWDLVSNPTIPPNYFKAHPYVVWFTGGTYPGPLGNYEALLASHLSAGGRLFLSGMDVLDQAAGTTSFVHDYLHVLWDGTETQNDIGTSAITATLTNTVTNGLGSLPLNVAGIYGPSSDFSDQVTPIAPAIPAFTDDAGQPDALTVDTGVYKVVFLAFPFEAIGSAGDRANLMGRIMTFFQIVPVSPNMNLAAAPNPVVQGQPLTLTTTFTGVLTSPLGRVTFTSDSGYQSVVLVDLSGAATASPSDLPLGARVITATYSGDLHYLPVTRTANVSVVAAAQNLQLSVNNGVTSTVPGTPATYSIAVTNTASITATGAPFTVSVPASLENVWWTCQAGPGSSCPSSGTGGIGTALTLAPNGGRALFSLYGQVQPVATGLLTVTGQIGLPAGFVSGTVIASDVDTLTPQTSLGVTVVVGGPPPSPGDIVVYTVTVTNTGPSAGQGLVVANFTPEMSSLTSTCSASAGSSCLGVPNNIVALAIGSTTTVSRTVFLLPGGTAQIVIKATTPSDRPVTPNVTVNVTPVGGGGSGSGASASPGLPRIFIPAAPRNAALGF